MLVLLRLQQRHWERIAHHHIGIIEQIGRVLLLQREPAPAAALQRRKQRERANNRRDVAAADVQEGASVPLLETRRESAHDCRERGIHDRIAAIVSKVEH